MGYPIRQCAICVCRISLRLCAVMWVRRWSEGRKEGRSECGQHVRDLGPRVGIGAAASHCEDVSGSVGGSIGGC